MKESGENENISTPCKGPQGPTSRRQIQEAGAVPGDYPGALAKTNIWLSHGGLAKNQN